MKNEEDTFMGHQPKLKDVKMENEENDGGCPWKRRPKTQHIYKNVILVNIIKKKNATIGWKC